MRVLVAVGTRPEIVKMAPVIRACQERGVELLLVHTGQHYSPGMAAIFYEQLGLPLPDIDLGVGSGTHAQQTAAILTRMEELILEHRPEAVLVEGDTNSVLAAGLAAAQSGVRLGHVEAGLRSHDRSMPEELNRTLVDHLADDLYAPTAAAAANLRGEGIPGERVTVTGNTIVDEVLLQAPRALATPAPREVPLGPYGVVTVHRAENTDAEHRLRGIIEGLNRVTDRLQLPLVLPLHPRTADRLERFAIPLPASIVVLPPIGYLESLALQARAALVITDSGGLQEEACTLGVPCVTVRDNTERPETLEVGANQLAGTDPERILTAASAMIERRGGWPNPFGDGRAGDRIVAALVGERMAPVMMDIARPLAPTMVGGS